MSIQESAKIVNLLHTAYFHLERTITVEELANRIDLWAAEFINYPYEVVNAVSRAWIRKEKWLPSVEEIKAAADLQLSLQKKLMEAGYISDLVLTAEEEAIAEAIWNSVTYGS